MAAGKEMEQLKVLFLVRCKIVCVTSEREAFTNYYNLKFNVIMHQKKGLKLFTITSKSEIYYDLNGKK